MTFKPDTVDKKLLTALQADARRSTGELAELVSMAQSPCWRRIRKLEEAGVICGYRATLDREALGWGVLGFVHLQMQEHTPKIAAAFERDVLSIPQVLACYNLSGRYDYMLEVIETDLKSISNLVRTRIRALPGVKEISTTFSLKEIKRTDALPVQLL